MDSALWQPVLLLVFGAGVITLAGARLAGVADRLADRTGLGEVIAGALFVGATTSLPGLVTSIDTAWRGYPGIAIGNGLGSLTVQTAFLAVTDLAYRRANLEHAAASATGLAQGTLLVTLLTLPLLATALPEVTLGHVHPLSPVLFIAYWLGLRLMARVRAAPMWRPVMTTETQKAEVEGAPPPKDTSPLSTPALWRRFALYAAATGAAGYLVAQAGIGLVERAGLSETAAGTVFTAIATSLPELVTALAAVRRGAMNLALGDIIGGNTFDVMFLAAADLAYREGSLYHRLTDANLFTALLAILMTGVLLLGMIRREQWGFAGIGFESATVLALYVGSVGLILL